MKGWEKNKKWSDRFLPEIKRNLGEYLIGEPPVEEDQERNTDLIVLKMEAVRIGCRVRRYRYLTQYSDEFTLRAGLPSGAKTELTKIVEGWGNYFFYGFCDKNELKLAKWILCDLNVFRLWFNRQLKINAGKVPGISKDNIDNSSFFLAFKTTWLPKEFIVAQYPR